VNERHLHSAPGEFRTNPGDVVEGLTAKGASEMAQEDEQDGLLIDQFQQAFAGLSPRSFQKGDKRG